MTPNVEADRMTSEPAVRCSSCAFTWNSAAMAEGLRLLGSCPRCSGTLEFRGDTSGEVRLGPRTLPSQAPHLVLGIPRR